MQPTYRAPRSVACRASSGRTMPQNLISTTPPTLRPHDLGERSDECFRIGRSGERGADEDGVGATVGRPKHVVDLTDSTFPDANHVGRNERNETLGHALVHGER